MSKYESELSTNNLKFSRKEFLKFLIPSLIGLFLFLFPVIKDGNLNIPLGILVDYTKELLKPVGIQCLYFVIILSALITIITKLLKPNFIMENDYLKQIFDVKVLGLFTRILSLIFVVILIFTPEGKYFNMVTSENTGALTVDLMFTIFVTFLITCFTIPLISDYGIMEFTGMIFKKFIHPLFRLPGRSAVDLITSWVGGNSTGILITIRQYEEGYYTAREAITISTMFSVVSLPFCLVIANTLGVGDRFMLFYFILAIVGIISTFIMVRIPPLSTFDNKTYNDIKYQTLEEAPEGISKFKWGIFKGVEKSKDGGSFVDVLKKGALTYIDLFFSLAPSVLVIAIISLIISEYTSIFEIISKPMGYYLNILGVENAFEAAPATIVGIADMFLPAIVASSIASYKTRFIIGVLSLVQIIYFSEMAAILLSSKIPVDLKHIIIIFLEKTIIALPLIVLFTNLLVN